MILSKVFWFLLIHWNWALFNSCTVTKGSKRIALFKSFSFKLFANLFTREIILYNFRVELYFLISARFWIDAPAKSSNTCLPLCWRQVILFNSWKKLLSKSCRNLLKTSRSLNLFSKSCSKLLKTSRSLNLFYLENLDLPTMNHNFESYWSFEF